MANSHRSSVGETRARQGRKGMPIVWVLVIGMALVILGFLITYAFHAPGFSSETAAQRATKPAQSDTFKAPPPSATSRQNYQKGAPLAPQNGGNPTNPPS